MGQAKLRGSYNERAAKAQALSRRQNPILTFHEIPGQHMNPEEVRAWKERAGRYSKLVKEAEMHCVVMDRSACGLRSAEGFGKMVTDAAPIVDSWRSSDNEFFVVTGRVKMTGADLDFTPARDLAHLVTDILPTIMKKHLASVVLGFSFGVDSAIKSVIIANIRAETDSILGRDTCLIAA